MQLHLSARAYFRILKLARTIADLASEKKYLAGPYRRSPAVSAESGELKISNHEIKGIKCQK